MFENELVAKGSYQQENSDLYEFKVSKDENNCVFITNESKESLKNTKFWDYRLGHLSIESMKNFRAEDLKFNSEKLVNSFCECCVLGKSTKLQHKKIEKSTRR